MRIAVAASGGVDSLYAMACLREAGYEVVAVHGRFFADQPQLGQSLAAICKGLGVELHVLDLTDAFQTQVIAAYLEQIQAGQTPNPCAVCNRKIKFGLFRQQALDLAGSEILATGHYARLIEHPLYGPALAAGLDQSKDQSYFLALTPIRILQTCLFPLGATDKPAVKSWLAARGLSAPAASESQEICFVPGHHRDFVMRYAQELPRPGPIRLLNPDGSPGRELGRHLGLWAYTEGQRKGLRLAWSEPLFVIKRDMASNTLLVGPKSQAAIFDCRAVHVNYLVRPEHWPDLLLVRSRYRQQPLPAKVEAKPDEMRITFLAPHDPVAPGQVAAVYDTGGCVLAGGIFEE